MEQIQKIDPMTFNPAAVRIAENNYASEFYRKIIEMINDFEASLNHDEEVGVRLISFGQTVQFHIEDLSYYNPSLIAFIGRLPNGSKVKLIQNVDQISFLLMALPKLNEDAPARRIGFKIEDTCEGGSKIL
ncbi:DUF6173 family protein [Neobacillus niacini]|uniref:DUF6173 family protein n=1 Tax=Neobacillus niacini TaxID=86668 RepID=UPI00285CA810|nr:DUF6173 family protein [Neobacillus niacini]MDR6999640.1 hypothetical protein [Neobacillus niacini]